MSGFKLAHRTRLAGLFTFRHVLIASVALIWVQAAAAAPVTFSTSGTFTCGGCAGSGTNSVTFLGGQGNAVMLTFTGLGSTSLNTPTGTSFGNFQTFVSGNGPINVSGTFTLTITQTSPIAGSGSFTGTFNGTFSASNSGSGTVNFPLTSTTILPNRYYITQNPVLLVPPASNNGITTVQGQINPITTAADVSVSGRVRTSDGRGLRGAVVWLTNSSGEKLMVVTSAFGKFRFDQVLAGETYIIGVSSKRYRSAPIPIIVTDQLADVDIIVQ